MNLDRLTNPAVRATCAPLHNTFRRMEAIEGRALSSITTLEDCHEHELSDDTVTPHSIAAGSVPAVQESAAPPPFNAIVAGAVETLRTLRTWP